MPSNSACGQQIDINSKLQVELWQQLLWSEVSSSMPSPAVMSANGSYTMPSQSSKAAEQLSTGMRVYGALGCADSACRNAGWTVQHTLLVLTSSPSSTAAQLNADASAIKQHLHDAYAEQLQAGQLAVNVQVSQAEANEGYHLDTQVSKTMVYVKFAGMASSLVQVHIEVMSTSS